MNDILQVRAYDVIRSKSLFISLASALGYCTITKSDVSSSKSFTLHLRFCVKSFIYILEMQRTQDEPCGTPAVISPR